MSVSAQPPSGWDPHQPKQRRKLSTLQKVIIVVAAVVLLCGGAVVAGGIYAVNTLSGATQPMRDAATGYLDDVVAHNYETAYGRLCERTRERYTRERFVAAVSADPPTGYKVTGIHIAKQNGLVDGTVTISRANNDGTKVTHLIPMRKDGDAWQVCGDPD